LSSERVIIFVLVVVSSTISGVAVSQNHTLLKNLDTLWLKIASGVLKDGAWIEGP